MSRRRQRSTSIRSHRNESEVSLRSDNLHVSASLSPSSFQKIARPIASRKKEKPQSETRKTAKRVPVFVKSKGSPGTGVPASGIPEGVAVHFGNFYSLGEESRKTSSSRDAGMNKSEFPARSEFTGQMVHKLERLAGTEHYARQVSALLEETVESPNFVVKPAPADNFVPCETSEPMDYPLWYKAPDEMPSRACEYSTSVENRSKGGKNERTKQIKSGEFITRASDSSGRRSADVADCESSDESSSGSSSRSLHGANAEEDSDYEEEVKVALSSSSKT